MKHKAAAPMVKAIRTFISDNQKVVNVQGIEERTQAFLRNMEGQMHSHEPWKSSTEAELDNAFEGLEKYVMSKLHKVFFQPDSDDAPRDELLSQRMILLSFIEPKHLDITGLSLEDAALQPAIQELQKLNTYKSPRDKLVCILNCCKYISTIQAGLHPEDGRGADTFLPLLIYTTLQANPPHLMSNLEYIQRFRSPASLQGEAGYILTNMFIAVRFIQNMNATQLSISESEFDSRINQALERLHRYEREHLRPPPPPTAKRPAPAASAEAASTSATPASAMADKGPTFSSAFSSVVALLPSTSLLFSSSPKADKADKADRASRASISKPLRPPPPPIRTVLSVEPIAFVGDTSAPPGFQGPPQTPTSEEMAELLAACTEPPVERFLSCDSDDLTLVRRHSGRPLTFRNHAQAALCGVLAMLLILRPERACSASPVLNSHIASAATNSNLCWYARFFNY
jgi:hypothetical protein